MELVQYEKFIVNVLEPQAAQLEERLSKVSAAAEGCRTLAGSLRAGSASSTRMVEVCEGCYAEVNLVEGGELLVELGLADTMVAMSAAEAVAFLEERGSLLSKRQELVEAQLGKVQGDLTEARSSLRQLYMLQSAGTPPAP